MSTEVSVQVKETKPILWGDGSYAVVRQDYRTGKPVEIVRATMRLSKARGELLLLGKDDTYASITAPGAERLNTVASVSVITTPQIVLGDGSMRVNPYIETDRNGTPLRVHVRRIGLGYSPIGVLSAQDETLVFDVQSYLMIDLLKKIRGTKKRPPDPTFGRLVDLDAIPEDVTAAAGTWKVLPYRIGIGIAVNIRHPDFLGILDTDAQRAKFAERIAQSICRRNTLLHHPAIGTRRAECTDWYGQRVRKALRAGESIQEGGWERLDDLHLEATTIVHGWRAAGLASHRQIYDIAAMVSQGDEAEAFARIESEAPRGHKADAVKEHQEVAHEQDDADVATAEAREAMAEHGQHGDIQDADWQPSGRVTVAGTATSAPTATTTTTAQPATAADPAAGSAPTEDADRPLLVGQLRLQVKRLGEAAWKDLTGGQPVQGMPTPALRELLERARQAPDQKTGGAA